MSIDRTKYMSHEEAKHLRTVTEARAKADIEAGRVTGVRTWMLVDFVLKTGLRVSEIVLVQVENIDLERLFMMVTRLKRKETKPEPLNIDQELAEHIQEYIVWTGHTEGPLFVGSRGPLTSRGLQQMWQQAIKRAGLPSYLSIHKGRHTLAVHLLPRTTLRQVQKQLGHLDPKTTAMYADIMPEQMREGLRGLYD